MNLESMLLTHFCVSVVVALMLVFPLPKQTRLFIFSREGVGVNRNPVVQHTR